MRYICFYLLLSLPFLFFCQENTSNTTIEVLYVKGYKNQKDTLKSEPKILKDLEYQLICTQEKSRFEYISGMSIDGSKNERFIGKGGGRGVYYSDLKENIKIHQTENPINSTKYLVKQELNSYNWELLDEKKEILGYDCYKATASVNEYNPIKKETVTLKYTVWYAPSIPVPFGPSGYDGLPGLVLESYHSSFYFIATEVNFSDKKDNIKRPKEGKEVSQEEYYKEITKSWLELSSKKN